MTSELKLRRKWTFRAHGEQMVFIKKTYESGTHVLTKALIWALYLPTYPRLSVEIPIGRRYKPDLVQLDAQGEPEFWGEAGRVGQRKLQTLLQRFRSTHFAFAKWDMNLEPFQRMIARHVKSIHRKAPVDLIDFPAESGDRFIRPDGAIDITFKDVTCMRF